MKTWNYNPSSCRSTTSSGMTKNFTRRYISLYIKHTVHCSVQFTTHHCSNILSVKIVGKHSLLDLFFLANCSGLPHSRSIWAVLLSFLTRTMFPITCIFTDLNAFFPEKPVNIFADLQIGYCYDSYERSSVFTGEIIADIPDVFPCICSDIESFTSANSYWK